MHLSVKLITLSNLQYYLVHRWVTFVPHFFCFCRVSVRYMWISMSGDFWEITWHHEKCVIACYESTDETTVMHHWLRSMVLP